MLFLRDGVDAGAVERVAAEEAAHGQTAARPGAVSLDGLLRVHAAARHVTAEAADERGERHPIDLNEQQEDSCGHGGPARARRGAGGDLGTHARPRVACTPGSRAWESGPGRNRAAS